MRPVVFEWEKVPVPFIAFDDFALAGFVHDNARIDLYRAARISAAHDAGRKVPGGLTVKAEVDSVIPQFTRPRMPMFVKRSTILGFLASLEVRAFLRRPRKAPEKPSVPFS